MFLQEMSKVSRPYTADLICMQHDVPASNVKCEQAIYCRSDLHAA